MLWWKRFHPLRREDEIFVGKGTSLTSVTIRRYPRLLVKYSTQLCFIQSRDRKRGGYELWREDRKSAWMTGWRVQRKRRRVSRSSSTDRLPACSAGRSRRGCAPRPEYSKRASR